MYNKNILYLSIATTILITTLSIVNPVIHTISSQVTTIPLVSTRDNFDLNSGNLITPEHNTTDYVHSNIPGLDRGNTVCPNEVAIYVHGVWASKMAALEQADRTRLTLATDHYSIPVIGFSWDSNTSVGPDGWNNAKNIANQNGPKLAHFLVDYLTTCKQNHQDVKIRLIGHSLGSRVIFNSLLNLDKNPIWKNKGFKIESVTLLGAAVNEEMPAKNTPFGTAIKDVVHKFFNLYDPSDVMLLISYNFAENHDALGLRGAYSVTHPINYIEQDVHSQKMQFRDANGTAQPDCLDNLVPSTLIGFVYTSTDNHCGYMGFRNPSNLNSIISDGAMGTAIADWKRIQ
jgi:pimeloyl-ACP methyl ester carboxylesterase